MTIKVISDDLISVLSNVSGARKLVNLTVIDRSLVVQSFEPVIMDEPIQIVGVVEEDNDTTITVEINASYNIINSGEEVTIEISSRYLTIQALTYKCRFSAAPVQRFDVDGIVCEDSFSIMASSFIDIANVESPMLSIAKSLKVGEPAVVIHGGFAYITLTNISCRIEVDLPDCVMSLKVVKAVAAMLSKLNVSIIKLEIEKDKGSYCIIRIGKNHLISFTVKRDNSLMPKTIDDLINSCELYSNISFRDISNSVRVISSTFKQIEVIVSIHKKGIYLVVHNDVLSQLNVGVPPQDKDYIMLRTNIVMMSALIRMFSGSNVIVKRGGRCLCCQNNKLTVLMSGVN